MNWETVADYTALSQRAAELLLGAIRRDPRIVLGLPTGRTPVGMYERVVAVCSREYHCFRDVVTFNLDEYVGPSREYHHFMQKHLFDHVDIDEANVHIPDGAAPDPAAECARYEAEIAAAGGLAVTFLGLGGNGHIAFNEPGTPFDARTRVVELSEHTRAANKTPATHAITMGIGTILESREIVLLVNNSNKGANKRAAIERLRGGEVSEDFPASALWWHGNVHVIVSE
jgi:glucosamine-6-phosphate deaminase